MTDSIEINQNQQEVTVADRLNDIDSILEPKELTPDDAEEQIIACLDRILLMESFFQIPADQSANLSLAISKTNNSLFALRYGWMLMTVRLITRSSANTDRLKHRFLYFILEDFRTRMDIALLWLHEEYYQDRSSCKLKDSYSRWCNKLLDAVRDGIESTDFGDAIEGLDEKDRTFTRLLVEIPYLGIDTINRVTGYCQDTKRMQLGVATLRDLIVFRPAVRRKCGDILLQYCTESESEIRSAAISAAIMFVPSHKFGTVVEQFASNLISELCDYTEEIEPPPKPLLEQMGESEMKKEDNTDYGQIIFEIIEKKSELYLNCATKKPELLHGYTKSKHRLFNLFPKFPHKVQNKLCELIESRISAMSTNLDIIVDLVKTFPVGSESLILIFIQKQADVENPEIIKAVTHSYMTRDLDARFLFIIIHTLTRDQIVEHLPRLINSIDGSASQADMIRSALTRLVENRVGEGEDDTITIFTPIELLLYIHNLEDSIGLKCIMQAVTILVETPTVFRQEVLAGALQNMVDQTKLPTLLMRTMIQSVFIS